MYDFYTNIPRRVIFALTRVFIFKLAINGLRVETLFCRHVHFVMRFHFCFFTKIHFRVSQNEKKSSRVFSVIANRERLFLFF